MDAALTAEAAYLFRHALLREVAYGLHVPSERAGLHAVCADILQTSQGAELAAASADICLHLAAARELDDSPALRASEIEFTKIAAEYAESRFQGVRAVELWRRRAQISDPLDAAESSLHAGAAAHNSGRLDEALELLANALALARSLHLPGLQARVLGTMAPVQRDAGLVDAAEQSATTALELASEAGQAGPAQATLASIQAGTGRLQQAEQTYGKALESYRLEGNANGHAIALSNLAGIYAQTSRHEQAEAAYRTALEVLRTTSNRRYEGVTLTNLATAYVVADRAIEAEEIYCVALDIHRHVGNRLFEGNTWAGIGRMLIELGRLEEAERACMAAVNIHRELGYRRGEGVSLGNAGVILHRMGRLPEAEQALVAAIQIHREVHNRRFEGMHTCELGLCVLALGRPTEARQAWLGGAAHLRESGDQAQLESELAQMREACAARGVKSFEP